MTLALAATPQGRDLARRAGSQPSSGARAARGVGGCVLSRGAPSRHQADLDWPCALVKSGLHGGRCGTKT